MVIDILAYIIAFILNVGLFLVRVVLYVVLGPLIAIKFILKCMLWYKRYMMKRFVYVAFEVKGYGRIR